MISTENIIEKYYFASLIRMRILAIFIGIFACPFWLVIILLCMELFKFDQGLKSLFILIPLVLVGFIAYILSRSTFLLFRNKEPILTLSPLKIKTIDYKGQGIRDKNIIIQDIDQVELKKTLLDRHYCLIFTMKDQTQQTLNFATGWMRNADILELKQSLDEMIPKKAKHIQ